MTDPFRPTQQGWEQLRQSVAKQHQEGDSIERRVERLETRFGILEVSLGKQLEALTVAYQHIASALDRLVTKDRFDAVRMQVHGLWICIAIGVAVYLFKR